jgi:hypothetical protein
MCLKHLDPRASIVIERLTDKADEDGYIWLWKVFDVKEDDTLVSQYHDYSFYEGKNTARGKFIKTYLGARSPLQYEPGFHCFTKKADAKYWKKYSADKDRERIIVPIKVKKEWITSVGYQAGTVIVCKHIII